jgi:hypothetical protein
MRRPWEAIRTAMQEELADLTWTELFFGTAFLAAGSRDTRTVAIRGRSDVDPCGGPVPDLIAPDRSSLWGSLRSGDVGRESVCAGATGR